MGTESRGCALYGGVCILENQLKLFRNVRKSGTIIQMMVIFPLTTRTGFHWSETPLTVIVTSTDYLFLGIWEY